MVQLRKNYKFLEGEVPRLAAKGAGKSVTDDDNTKARNLVLSLIRQACTYPIYVQRAKVADTGPPVDLASRNLWPVDQCREFVGIQYAKAPIKKALPGKAVTKMGVQRQECRRQGWERDRHIPVLWSCPAQWHSAGLAAW